ncbi:hypothetical protein Glove_120g7 [Diversispora epigaea]|uniref:Uncharacterized protein n=1 Tax=Diversispora epigaea TaxID=1348612 RepID=A0A397J002_9GLOM|nr:hypothetical protein Glove_120g7 [Diversispora epigaea]
MSTELYNKIYEFLTTTEDKKINAISVIYLGMKEDRWIDQNELRAVVNQAVTSASTGRMEKNRMDSDFCSFNQCSNVYMNGSERQLRIFRILTQFDSAFEGVNSLYDIGAIKTDKEQPLSSDQIVKNVDKLKRKLCKDTSSLYQYLYSDVNKIPVQELTWKDPLASQVIRDNSDLVQKLPGNLKKAFMKPVKSMKPILISKVEDMCKGVLEKISYVVEEVLSTLKDIWNNPALSTEVAKTLNEGTYQSTVIVLTIRAVLKNLPLGPLSFISTSERQSIASADRRGVGRRPDIMFVIKHLDVFFELMYIECSRLFCTEQKKIDDDIKLWRECNDGMYYTRKTLNPDKDQFGIVGVQIAGDTLHLNVLIRDKTNVHRYYHIQSAKIPVRFSVLEKISYVVEEVLSTLKDIWNNPALSTEVAKTLNEGTYQSTVIVLTIRAVLKNLPLGPLSFISTSERQSIASADRRGVGRRPDIMFVIKHLDVFFELMYIECSRLFCTEQKKIDDDIKLWRECNDGMYYTRKTLNPDKDQFGIVGVQIAGDTLHLNVLIRDKTNVHRYYHIQSAKIPVRFSGEGDVIKFVETLLFLRNILITNISLLCHGSVSQSQRLVEGSTTVTTPRDDYQ